MPIPDVLCGIVLIVYGWQQEGLPVTFCQRGGICGILYDRMVFDPTACF